MRSISTLKTALVVAATGALLGAGVSPVAAGAGYAGPASASSCDDGSSAAARVRKNSHAKEPVQDPNAKAYGRIKAHSLLPEGSVTIPTRFNLVSDHDLTPAEEARWTTLVQSQMRVLNDSFSGATAADAAESPFRFELEALDFVNAPQWYHVTPGKAERDMKHELYEGDSTTLNVYAADIGDGLLGFAYFPQGYNNGRDYIDGVVMLDESMPGGTAGKYAEGDTLTHEVGHWLALHHTFQAGCSASNDFVVDTPKEASPAFDCPLERNTCTAPGLDPIHNFMDYTQDSCMNMFTPGQVQRMNDAWLEFRA